MQPVIATPQSSHPVPDLPILEADVTVFIRTIRIRCLPYDVRVGQLVVIITVWVRRILISDVYVRLHAEIVERRVAILQDVNLTRRQVKRAGIPGKS